MDAYDNIFVVNLPIRKDRLAFMKYKLGKEQIENYTIVPAVNGYSDE